MRTEAALRWYQSTTKAEILMWCERNGVDLSDPNSENNGNKLSYEWPDIAIAAYATKLATSPYVG